MTRGSLGWYRYRMISGVIFALLGVLIAIEIMLRPGPPQNKIPGFAFAFVALALGAVRVGQYRKARAATRAGERR